MRIVKWKVWCDVCSSLIGHKYLLSCLSRALGFQPDTIKNCVPNEITNSEDGLSLKMVRKLIDLKYFNDALDVSINMHSADYNINSILKSLKLLNHRLLSFSELHDVRVAFQVYEAGDMRGMMIDQHTLIRTLKLCGRTIAPLKLIHRVKHMQEDFDEPGRIQLYEFLDLIVLCEQTADIEVPESKRGPLDKTWRKLFELDDFEHVCATNDEKLLNHLNQDFRNTELNYGHEQLGSKRMLREAAVDTTVRKTQVRFHANRYKQLHKFLGQSTSTLQHSKAGCIRERPVTVPEVSEFRLPVTSPIPQLQRPLTSAESQHSGARPISAPSRTPTPGSRPGSRSRSRPWSKNSKRSREDEFYIGTPLMQDPRMKLLQAFHDRKTLQSGPGHLLSSPTPRVTFARDTRTAPENMGRRSRPWLTQESDEQRPHTTAVVSTQDVVDRQNILDSLQYEIETLEERRMQKLKEQIRQHLPKFNLDNLTLKEDINAPGVTKKKKHRRKSQPSAEAIARLVNPDSKKSQGTHSKHCDALAQGGPKRTDRKTKQKKKTEKMLNNLAPLLMLDGKQYSNDQDGTVVESTESKEVKDERGVETASTMSSRTAESSIAKSLDLIPHTYHGRMHHVRMQPKDPEKFKSARVGAAAVLYNHFNTDSDSDHKKSADKKGARSAQSEGKGQVNGTIERQENPNKNSNHIIGSLLVPTAIRNEDVDLGHRSNSGRSKVAPKSAGHDDELKINGLSLSEMVTMSSIKKDVDKSDEDRWQRL